VFNGVAALVDKAMVMPAKEHQVVEARLAAVSPVAHVMSVDEEMVLAAGKAAAAIAAFQGSA